MCSWAYLIASAQMCTAIWILQELVLQTYYLKKKLKNAKHTKRRTISTQSMKSVKEKRIQIDEDKIKTEVPPGFDTTFDFCASKIFIS